MGEAIGFNTLKVGQRVKVKGKPAKDGSFVALEVSIKSADENAACEGKIQGLDPQKNSIRLMEREFILPSGIEIANVQRKAITLGDLKVGDVVKLKGAYSASQGFTPVKVKMQEFKGFSIEELQGDIQQIDPAGKTLNVLGFTIITNEKTEIEGFDRPERRDRGDRPDRSERPDRPDRPHTKQ